MVLPNKLIDKLIDKKIDQLIQKRKHKERMAHLITLTNADSNEDILFNLDTVVSIEKGHQNTIITTRWGRQYVKDTLDDIMDRAEPTKRLDASPQA